MLKQNALQFSDSWQQQMNQIRGPPRRETQNSMSKQQI